ncbi:hypothetical protein KKC97_00860 [bacterium]|nr:hypothetical protein [bacterium]MBU1636200.1 hypothetical protein [bacterium]MBU1920003.1 hypothetical protein [bacterium]
MRCFFALFLLAVLLSPCRAQFPEFTQEQQQTYNYEDLSDFLRRYPGIYPLDYGTLGAPLLIRPWNLHPWELKVWRDGIPMNRLGDGLYDSNLQPSSELEKIQYSFLAGSPGGEFHLQTRSLPVDSPYTELQIREGYYGYGTVDFAHGQRVKDDFTMEVTGRLGWYDGARTLVYGSTLSRLNRLRGCFGFDAGERWRLKFVYEGSHVNADTDISGLKLSAPHSQYVEREQAILSIQEKDSLKSVWSPSLSVFVRQDREKWESYYKSREAAHGWVLRTRIPVPKQRLSLRQTGMFSRLDSPSIHQYDEVYLELQAIDSLNIGIGELALNGSVRRESALKAAERSEWSPLVGGGVEFNSRRLNGFSFKGGSQYTESLTPIQWIKDEYRVVNRPLPIDQAFVTEQMSYVYMGSYQSDEVRGVDRFLNTQAGLDWRHEGYAISPTLQVISPQGEFHSNFENADSSVVTLVYSKHNMPSNYIASLYATLPLKWGFSLETNSFRQFDEEGVDNNIGTRSYNRLYFERDFFKAPLRVKAHISYDYIGPRSAYSDKGIYEVQNYYLVGLRLSGTIRGVTLVWGVENFMDQYFTERFELMPGYVMNHKEEYFGVIWRLWL